MYKSPFLYYVILIYIIINILYAMLIYDYINLILNLIIIALS